MNNTFTKVALGFVTVISGGVYVPIVPSELEAGLSEFPAMRGYQYEAGSDRAYYKQTTVVSKEGVETTIVENNGPLPDADFIDEDNNGIISVAVYRDTKGQDVYKKITDAEYYLMGIAGGAQNNPEKTELVSIFDAFTQTAEAAVAYDATSTGFAASASSLTYEHINTGSQLSLAVGTYTWNAAHTITGVTYNGVAMTQLVTRAADGTGGKIELWGLMGPATGANNIVITASAGGVQFFGNSVSYTGTSQIAAFPDTETNGSSNNTSFSESITTSVDQSWVLAVGRSPSRAPAAGANTVVRKLNPTSGDAGWLLDSNAARSTGSNALAWSYAPTQTTYWAITSIAPAAGGTPEATTTPRINVSGDITIEGDIIMQ